MPELTMIATQFAEAALIVRTLLLLLSALSWLLRVPIDTVRVHLVTHSIFLEELTDGNLLLVVKVQILAVVALSAHLFEPVDAHLFLALVFVWFRRDRADNHVKLINRVIIGH